MSTKTTESKTSSQTLTKPDSQKEPSSMEELISLSEAVQLPKVGSLIEGKVVAVSKTEILVDIDGQLTGIIRGPEVIDETGEYKDLKKGDKVQATVLDLENEKGLIELSLRHASHQKIWQELNDLQKSGEIVSVTAIDANKGGLIAKYGQIYGFLPVSLLKPEHYPRVPGGDKTKIFEKLKSYIDQEFLVKVIDVDEREEKVIFSEKATDSSRRQELMKNFKEGEIIEGRVTSIVDFGIFVELTEGIEGLVHVSELSWQRVNHPREVVREGEKVKVKIMNINGDKISLSIKELSEDPWQKIKGKYKIGQVVKGKVVKIDQYGAFIEVESNIIGLVYKRRTKSQQPETKDKLMTELKTGQVYEFIIENFEPAEHKLGLAVKNESKVAQ